MPKLLGWVALLLLLACWQAPGAGAQAPITIDDRGVEIEFPQKLTFRARVRAQAPIKEIMLEYGVRQQTCGEVVGKVFPSFKEGRNAEVAWTWEMLQSGSEPPGATIWYRWRVSDEQGNEQVSETSEISWIDDSHEWQVLRSGPLALHWYHGDEQFAQQLLQAGTSALEQLGETTGVVASERIDMFIYGDTEDMREAVLYEPGWTGGLAFPSYNILLIGVSPDQLEWGSSTVAHELTHVLVGHLTFSCLGGLPNWLNEGIAVYGEGGLDPASQKRLGEAIKQDTLLPLRALSGAFSEHADKADLSYAQSYSLVNFLIEEHGEQQLLALFRSLRDGVTIEQALRQSYAFGLDGLEQRWRESIGAAPRGDLSASATPIRSPTVVPTYQPVQAVALAVGGTGEGQPERGPGQDNQELPAPESPPGRASPIILAAIGASALLGLLLLAAGLRMRRRT